MKSSCRIVLAGILVILFLAPVPILAIEELFLQATWNLTPESDMNHPRYKTIVLVAQEKMRIVTCLVNYGHERYRFVTALGERVDVQQPKGGSVTLTLERVTKTGSAKLDQRSLDSKHFYDGGWVDTSGRQDGDRDYTKSSTFPLQVKKNEALLFVLEFSNMPRIQGVKRSGGEIQYDWVGVSTSCSTCGSNDSPCPGTE